MSQYSTSLINITNVSEVPPPLDDDISDKKNIYSKKLKVVLDKLNNKAFIDKAPDNVIENFKIQEKEINSSIEKIDEIINTIN